MQQPSASVWPRQLYAARTNLHLSRKALGKLAGVSEATIKAYELGFRQPTRVYLVAILDALRVERHTRNEIMTSAGFAPDGDQLGASHTPHYSFPMPEAKEHVEKMPWPAFVLNEYTEVVCCNDLVERLWGIDLEREFPNPLDRNLVSVASSPRFADRVENWEEMMAVGASVFKGHHRGPDGPEQPSVYFAQIVQRFMAGDPKYATRMAEIWAAAPPREPKIRWEYEVRWREPGLGRMHFFCIVNTANEQDGLAFNDWIPVDAESWERLGKLPGR